MRGSRRLAGIGLNKVCNRHALNAVVELSTQPNGFSLDQLTTVVRARSGWSADQYSARHAAYDLAKLRGKKLIHPVEHSRRYRADPSGVRTLCAYLVLRDKVIKPLVVGGERPLGRPPKNLARLINIT